MIGAVTVHDRQPFAAVILGSGLGNISDTAVKEGRFSGEARVNAICTFVSRTPPVTGIDDKTLTGQFGFEGDVIKITTHRQLAVAIGADKTLDQGRSIGAGPIGELRRCHFGKADTAHLVPSQRFEQSAGAQIADNHIADFIAQFGGGAGRGFGAPRGWQAGHGNGQFIGADIVYINGQLGMGR